MSVVCAEEKEDNRDAEQELLRWGVLVSVVDLLPHVQIVVGSGVELEGYPPDVVEHEV